MAEFQPCLWWADCLLAPPRWFAVSAFTCLSASQLVFFSVLFTLINVAVWRLLIQCQQAHGFVYSHSRGVHPGKFTFVNEGNVRGTIKCRYNPEGGIMESSMRFVRDFTFWFRGWWVNRLPQNCNLLSEWRCLNIQLKTNDHESLTCRWRVRDPFPLTAPWSCGMWEEAWHWADAPHVFSPWYTYLHTDAVWLQIIYFPHWCVMDGTVIQCAESFSVPSDVTQHLRWSGYGCKNRVFSF